MNEELHFQIYSEGSNFDTIYLSRYNILRNKYEKVRPYNFITKTKNKNNNEN